VTRDYFLPIVADAGEQMLGCGWWMQDRKMLGWGGAGQAAAGPCPSWQTKLGNNADPKQLPCLAQRGNSSSGAPCWLALVRQVPTLCLPLSAPAEAGFGGPLNAYELTKHLIEAGAAGGESYSQAARCGGQGLCCCWVVGQ
jgi:isocitrate lyase